MPTARHGLGNAMQDAKIYPIGTDQISGWRLLQITKSSSQMIRHLTSET